MYKNSVKFLHIKNFRFCAVWQDKNTFIRNLTVCALLAFGIHIDVIHKYLPDIEKKYGAGLQPES